MIVLIQNLAARGLNSRKSAGSFKKYNIEFLYLINHVFKTPQENLIVSDAVDFDRKGGFTRIS